MSAGCKGPPPPLLASTSASTTTTTSRNTDRRTHPSIHPPPPFRCPRSVEGHKRAVARGTTHKLKILLEEALSAESQAEYIRPALKCLKNICNLGACQTAGCFRACFVARWR
jgi:hypothetical protein